MITSKERAALRAQANPLDVTLIVGKGGISRTLLDEAVILLDSHELVKGRVLETAGLSAREASDEICQALGAEGIGCVGTKFVIWRKSEKLEKQEKKKGETQEKPRARKLKFSFKEQREFETIEDDIAALEQALEENRRAQEQAGSDFEKLQGLMEEQKSLESQLETKTERWMYLTELAERIEKQES